MLHLWKVNVLLIVLLGLIGIVLVDCVRIALESVVDVLIAAIAPDVIPIGNCIKDSVIVHVLWGHMLMLLITTASSAPQDVNNAPPPPTAPAASPTTPSTKPPPPVNAF